jgi:hypothetical protein
MFDHDFQKVPHLRIGPILNKYGWLIAVAEIGDSWFLRWQSPSGITGTGIYPDHVSCVDAIQTINDLSKGLTL